MSIIPPTISGAKKTTIVAIATSLIGTALIVTLLAIGLIGETSFSALFTVMLLIGLFIAFSNRVESISLKELTLTLATVQEIQQAVIAKETEPTTQRQECIFESFATNLKVDSIIKAIGSSSYTFRNIEGITKDTNMPLNEVENSLNWLLSNKLAIESPGIGGFVYSLTPKGRNLFSNLLK